MLLVLTFLGGSALLGVCLIHRCFRDWLNAAEQVLWGIVVGWVVSAVVTYGVARWLGRLTASAVTWTTLVIWVCSVVLLLPSISHLSLNKIKALLSQTQFTYCLLLLCLFSPIYWQLFSSHFFARGADGIYSGGSAAADLNFHAALTSSFLYGNNFPPKNPTLFSEPLTYPFIPDFQTAALMTGGISMRSALLISSFTLAIVATGLMFYVGLRITQRPTASFLAVILILLNGGLGFVDLIRDWISSSKGFWQFWNTLDVNYANYAARGLHWPNIITDGFVPQRTLLFGMPIALIVITIFAVAFQESGKERPERSVWLSHERALLFAGILTGLLPWFHVHTYIAVGLLSGFLFLLRPRRSWLWFWIPAVLIAAPQIRNFLVHASALSFVRIQPGWMGHDSFIPIYLLRNLGLPLLLAIPAWLSLGATQRKFYIAFLLLLAFTFIVVVSPNIFDNGKLIYYWHILNSVIVGNWLVKLGGMHRQRAVAGLLTVLCIATGVSALRSESLQRTRVFDVEDLEATQFVKSQTSAKELFLTAPIVNQPLLSLAGRSIVRGPTSWLWSHGYEFRDREADVRRIYAGGEDARELLSYYGVDYVFIGSSEKAQLNVNPTFFGDNFPAVYQNSSIIIYDVRAQKAANKTLQPRELAKRVAYDPFAFFVEFSQTSFFVYRTYLVSNGRMPRVDEMMNDMSVLGRGVAIGFPGWQQQLEKNQSALLNSLMQMDHEKWAPLSNGDFVKTIFTNAGLYDDGLQDELIQSLDSNAGTRESVLRRVIDNDDLREREYNRAFVLTHYFGYFGRNPDDRPDSGMEGFNYWLGILNASGDYRSLSRAFLESQEYQNRR